MCVSASSFNLVTAVLRTQLAGTSPPSGASILPILISRPQRPGWGTSDTSHLLAFTQGRGAHLPWEA